MSTPQSSPYTVLDIREGRFGKKVVALRALPAGSQIIKFTGRKMNFEETKKQDDKESFALQTGIDDYVFLNPPCCYFNHSCEPNCGLTPELNLITLRPVAEGEELAYDYSTTMLERSWTMPCDCGKPKCRRVVRDFDQIPAELQKYYIEKHVVQDYILQRISGDGR
jgi:hypothetical protein